MSQYKAKKRSRKNKIKYKKKKSIWKNFVFRITLWSAILIILLAYLLLFSPLLAIKEIKVVAPADLDSLAPVVKNLVNNELERHFAVFSIRKSFFLLNTEDIKKKILSLEPAIEDMLIKKVPPNTLYLELKERAPQAIWCYVQDNICYLIDREGVIFKATSEKNLPVILGEIAPSAQIPLEVIRPEKMAQIMEIFVFFSERLKINTQYVTTDAQEKLNLKTQEGWEVYFPLGGDIKAVLVKLGLLIENNLPEDKRKDLQYIDLRFSKAYYK